jgi:hypothetical protein
MVPASCETVAHHLRWVTLENWSNRAMKSENAGWTFHMLHEDSDRWFLLVLGTIVIALELCIAFLSVRHGLDLTDEGYALMWIKDPSAYRFTITHFGMFYHPFYLMTGQSVVLLRILNFAFTIGLAVVLFWQIVKVPDQDTVARRPFARVVIVASAALSALSYTQFWLPTPNYNWLTLQGQLICCIGLTQAAQGKSENSKLASGAILTGFGGWMIFMGKPPNAVATGALVAMVWILGYRFPLRRIALALLVFFTLIVLTAFTLGWSFPEFVVHLIDSNEFSRRLRQNDTWSIIWRVDALIWTPLERAIFISIAVVCFSVSTLILFNAKHRLLLALLVAISLAAGIAEWAIFQGHYKRSLMQGLWIFAPSIGNAAAVGIYVFRGRATDAARRISLRALPATALMPIAYAIGSGNNLWLQSGSAGVFSVATCAMFVVAKVSERSCEKVLLWHGLSSAMVVLILTSIGTNDPYRQTEPLLSQVSESPNLPYLEKEMANYISSIRSAVGAAPDGQEVIMLDMSGLNPGLTFAIGAKVPGQPWLLGGYPGSSDFARAALMDTSCSDLASAFVLMTPEGKRKLPDDTLNAYGLKLEEDYGKVLEIAHPVSGETVVLLAPTHPAELESSCLEQRRRVPIESILAKVPPRGALDRMLEDLVSRFR